MKTSISFDLEGNVFHISTDCSIKDGEAVQGEEFQFHYELGALEKKLPSKEKMAYMLKEALFAIQANFFSNVYNNLKPK